MFNTIKQWIYSHHVNDDVVANLIDMCINMFIMALIFVWPVLRTHVNHFGWPIILEIICGAFNLYRLYDYLEDEKGYVHCFILSFLIMIAIMLTIALVVFMFIYEI